MKSSTTVRPHSFRHTLFGRLGTVGLIVAIVFWCAAARPTLLPRPWIIQSAISALSLLIGYGIGGLVALLYRVLQGRLGRRRPGEHTRARTRLVVGITGGVLLVAGAVAWQWWQTDQLRLRSGSLLAPALAHYATNALAFLAA